MTIAQKTGSDPVIEPDPVFVRTPQQAKNIGPTLALNGYLYGSYMGNP